MDFNSKLQKYAKLAVKTGVNIQPGQTLLVRTPIECAEYVRYVVEEAYKAGAKNVHIEWSDEKCNLIKYLNALRVAPSISNCQPWTLEQRENGFDIFENEHKKKSDIEKYIKMSMGVALNHFSSYVLHICFILCLSCIAEDDLNSASPSSGYPNAIIA